MIKGKSNSARPIARRTLIVGAAAGGAILAARFPTPAIAQQKTVKIGFIGTFSGAARRLRRSRQFHRGCVPRGD
jgi:hypothetical protein